MRSETVHTHFRCNQACTFCTARRPADDPAFIAAAAVKQRIDQAVEAGAEEVWLSGGEPTMRNDLVALVEHARARGVRTIGLETNATLVDDARAQQLAAAGLHAVRVNLPGWGPEVDAITRDPGGFEAALRGLDALLATPLRVELSLAVVRSTAALLPSVPGHLHARYGERGPRGLVLSVPLHSPDPREVLPYAESAPVIAKTEAAARAVGLPVKLHPASLPPPCIFVPSERPYSLFSLTPGARRREGHRPIPECASCEVKDRCDGFSDAYLARFPAPTVTPIADERMRRRLSLIGTVEQQIAREIVTPNIYVAGNGEQRDEAVIRVNFQCNQACRFCFVSTHLPGPGDQRVREAIEAAGARNADITLSGGEPTLNPNLLEYVRLAKRHSRGRVQLQTNAIKLGDPSLCRALEDAGLDELFVSLHGSTADISDAVTQAPGTFERTVRGLDELAKTTMYLMINFVICEKNQRDLVPFVRLVAERWPKAFTNISFVAPSTDVVPRDREMVPRYTDVMPHLASAIDEAHRLGLTLGGFQSMCGLPLCLVPAALERFVSDLEIPPGFDGGEFEKAEACRGCKLADRCFGLRRGYLALYGSEELRRVS